MHTAANVEGRRSEVCDLVVRPAAWQLAIFFPAMAFGWMRLRTDGLLAPVLYHVVCNLGMVVLQSSYR